MAYEVAVHPKGILGEYVVHKQTGTIGQAATLVSFLPRGTAYIVYLNGKVPEAIVPIKHLYAVGDGYVVIPSSFVEDGAPSVNAQIGDWYFEDDIWHEIQREGWCFYTWVGRRPR